MKTLYLGADHAGFALKEKVKAWLDKKKIPYRDLGNTVLDAYDDYPDFAGKVASHVARTKRFGILFCGSAQGMCIAANKVNGIRAVVPFSLKEAQLSREHNDANVLCLSGWYFSSVKAIALVHKFLSTQFSGEVRHKRRLRRIALLER